MSRRARRARDRRDPTRRLDGLGGRSVPALPAAAGRGAGLLGRAEPDVRPHASRRRLRGADGPQALLERPPRHPRGAAAADERDPPAGRAAPQVHSQHRRAALQPARDAPSRGRDPHDRPRPRRPVGGARGRGGVDDARDAAPGRRRARADRPAARAARRLPPADGGAARVPAHAREQGRELARGARPLRGDPGGDVGDRRAADRGAPPRPSARRDHADPRDAGRGRQGASSPTTSSSTCCSSSSRAGSRRPST